MRKAFMRIIAALLILEELLEYLALPVLFAVVGALNGFGWQYYAWTIGGYAVLVLLAELTGALIGMMLGKAFELRLLRKLSRAARPHESKEQN